MQKGLRNTVHFNYVPSVLEPPVTMLGLEMDLMFCYNEFWICLHILIEVGLHSSRKRTCFPYDTRRKSRAKGVYCNKDLALLIISDYCYICHNAHVVYLR